MTQYGHKVMLLIIGIYAADRVAKDICQSHRLWWWWCDIDEAFYNWLNVSLYVYGISVHIMT